ncbi:hypothetical protein NE237_020321 [Protea cynaroides]|uniref:Uncharacterized protein n=1 Tax=Protea cynaroides TaxID=273540 RepID=A0A9Q0H5R8_9MAGN|nr:hypothetical protein NE237_020321 [Protea cynaroides]
MEGIRVREHEARIFSSCMLKDKKGKMNIACSPGSCYFIEHVTCQSSSVLRCPNHEACVTASKGFDTAKSKWWKHKSLNTKSRSLIDVWKEVSFCKNVGVRVLVLIESMSGLQQPLTDFSSKEGAAKSAWRWGNLSLGRCPWTPRCAMLAQEGRSRFADQNCGASAPLLLGEEKKTSGILEFKTSMDVSAERIGSSRMSPLQDEILLLTISFSIHFCFLDLA